MHETLKIFTSLITFERGESEDSVLPPHVHGACAHIAVLAIDEDDVARLIYQHLMKLKLHTICIENITEVTSVGLIHDIDDHLAEGVVAWGKEDRFAWGTLYTYMADGEA